MRKVHVVDSHTAGEPTRVIVEGGPALSPGTLAQRVEEFRRHHDEFRRSVILEPRGTEALVGALLTPPEDSRHAAGVIFFNNVGYLGMCGHGTIGLTVTLAHLGKIRPGTHWIGTPVGAVRTQLHDDGRVTFRNVECFRTASRIEVAIEGGEVVVGDVAWGGNWFFVVEESPVELVRGNLNRLVDFAGRIRATLRRLRITGADGAEIDHIELSGPARDPANDSRNFVLCPGFAYDRSPCGTGTSAKLACRYAEGTFRPGDVWRQEGILGSVFEGRLEVEGDRIYPHITGSAFVVAEADLLLDDRDPFRFGVP